MKSLPQEWKNFIITPKFKKGLSTYPANYPPIALHDVVHCVQSIFEILIITPLMQFLTDHKLNSPPSQHGFLRKHSTTTNLHSSLRNWTLSNHRSTTICYKHFQQAFKRGRSWIIYFVNVTSGQLAYGRQQKYNMKYAYWREGKHVEIYERRCDMCCRNRKGPQFQHGLLQIAPGLTVMQKFHINLTDFQDRSWNEFTYLLMVNCCLSKYLVAVPWCDRSALSVARALIKHVYMVFGAPEFVVNDRGREFVSKVLDNVYKLVGVREALTTSFRPSNNGIMECVHATIIQFLPSPWRSHDRVGVTNKLVQPFVVFAYNCAYHVGIIFSPFYVMFLREPRVSLDLDGS